MHKHMYIASSDRGEGRKTVQPDETINVLYYNLGRANGAIKTSVAQSKISLYYPLHGGEEREVFGVESIPVAILPSCYENH